MVALELDVCGNPGWDNGKSSPSLAKGSIFDDFKSHPQTQIHEKCEKDPTKWSVVKAHLILQSVRSQICSYSMETAEEFTSKRGRSSWLSWFSIMTKYREDILSYHQTLATARVFQGKIMASRLPRRDAFRLSVEPLLFLRLIESHTRIWNYSKSIPTPQDPCMVYSPAFVRNLGVNIHNLPYMDRMGTLESPILWCNYWCWIFSQGQSMKGIRDQQGVI